MDQGFRIGIIDDDSSKKTQIMVRLMNGVNEASAEKQEKYSAFKFEPIELEIKPELKDMVDQVTELDLDCVLVDYKLSSYQNVYYSGIELAKSIEKALYDFPIFILTSYEDDLFSNEVFNAYQVFDFARYLSDKSERIELNYKIIEQILKSKKQKEQLTEELIRLLPMMGKNQEIDSRIMELDSILEKSLSGEHALSVKIKKDLGSSKLVELIEKIDMILEGK